MGTYKKGRIIEYSKKKGYGFIHTEDGKKIFVSSYNFLNNAERKVVIGSLVGFYEKETMKGLVAEDCDLIEKYPNGEFLDLGGYGKYAINGIKEYGLVNGEHAANRISTREEIPYDEVCGYYEDINDLKFVYIAFFKSRSLVFYPKDCPVPKTEDGFVYYIDDIEALKQKLDKFFLKI